MVYQLTYASRAFGFSADVLWGILQDARRCNTRDGITGTLVCRADLYLQLLEGPQDKVEAAFGRIAKDDRHLDIQPLSRGEVAARLFPDWAMRHDPARSWMWSAADVAAGAIARSTPQDVAAVFERIAREPDEPVKRSCTNT
jgi:hypothetical protein